MVGDAVSWLEDHEVLLHGDPFPLPAVRARDVFHTAQATKPSAPGLDGWTIQDLQLLPVSVWGDVARVFGLAEAGM
eukprot:2615000-Alexandrium_andersonii.AAC.1